jgi:hypothetical protein
LKIQFVLVFDLKSFEVLVMSMVFPSGSHQWDDSGVILAPEKSVEGSFIQNFTCSAEPLDQNRWRIWYSTLEYGDGYKGFNIAYAEGIPGQKMWRYYAALSSDVTSNSHFSIGNLPEGWRPVQPVHLVLPDGTQRLYFWAHGPDVVRYLVADSSDGQRYEVRDPYHPCLYHPCDRAVDYKDKACEGLANIKPNLARPQWEDPAPLDMVCNDATNVYLLADNTFELYTANVISVSRGDPRYVAHDNAPGLIRVIERRTSSDGIVWSKGTRVIEPDADDPSDMQFYYLAVNHLPIGRVGMLGHYRVEAQTMDIEWCFSTDGIHWQRPCRQAWLLRNEAQSHLYGVYAPHAAVFHERKWWLFYTGVNYTHNNQQSYGSPCSDIRLATISDLYK